SRIASGRVVRSPGLKRKGFVASDNLQPWKARILLALALSKTTNADDIQRMFDTYYLGTLSGDLPSGNEEYVMKADLVVKNGSIVTPEATLQGGVAVAGGKIVA